jgi:hypothetical protein
LRWSNKAIHWAALIPVEGEATVVVKGYLARSGKMHGFRLGAGIAVASALLGLTACGGSSGPNNEEVARLRRQGAERVHKEERLRKLESEVKHIKHGGSTQAPVTTRTQSSPPIESPSSSLQACDQNISANSATSCPFAENVFVAYWEDYEAFGEQAETYISAYSPTTEESYGMSCSFDGTTVDCSGANEAFVTFPMQAVRVY